MEQAAQSSEHSSKLREFKECMDIALIWSLWVLGVAVWSRELTSMILVNPFQFAMFCDSVTVRLFIYFERAVFIGPPFAL